MSGMYSVLALIVYSPTLLLYGWVVVFLVMSVRAGQARSAPRCSLYCALALAPVAWFGVVYAAAVSRHRDVDARVVAAQSLPVLRDAPRTLVIHGTSPDQWHRDLVDMGAFDEVYVVGGTDVRRLATARRAGCDKGAVGGFMYYQDILRARTGFLVCASSVNVSAYPEDGLHLYLTSPERTPSGGYLWQWNRVADLRLIEGGRSRQIGFWGIPRMSYPVIPPIVALTGFARDTPVNKSAVPWNGEIPFLFERLGFDAQRLKPLAQPLPEEIRTEFLRRRDSPKAADQYAAGYIAKALGATALSANDVAPLLASKVIDSDLSSQVGDEQFCNHINRLCDFPDRLLAACRLQRGENSPRCDRITAQCRWCSSAKLCLPQITGSLAGCSAGERAARESSLKFLRRD